MKEITQLIKYPVKYDKLDYFFDADNNMVAQIRGFRRLGDDIDIVAQFIEDAINEKLKGFLTNKR